MYSFNIKIPREIPTQIDSIEINSSMTICLFVALPPQASAVAFDSLDKAKDAAEYAKGRVESPLILILDILRLRLFSPFPH
jgi:hypothetical protein